MEKLRELYARSLRLNAENDADFYDCVGDLLATEQIQSQAAFAQHDSINRLQHITSVAYLSLCLCRHFKLDYRLASRAGLLHDLTYYDWHDNDWSHRPHGYRHPGFAVKNARELCGGIDKKTENIIKRHMWPLTVIPPKYKEAYIVCFADKYCAKMEYAFCRGMKRKNEKDGK